MIFRPAAGQKVMSVIRNFIVDQFTLIQMSSRKGLICWMANFYDRRSICHDIKKGFRSLAFEADDWDLIQFPEEFPLILKYQLGSQWLGTTWILIFPNGGPEKVNEIVVTLLCKFYNLAGTTRMPTTLRWTTVIGQRYKSSVKDSQEPISSYIIIIN